MAKKIANLPSGKVFLQVLGCGIEDAAPCLFLFTDSKRYMFNCGEGTQRMFTENKVKLGKLNTIFFTHNKWSHLGGFLGMSMTLRDIGKENIGIHGPTGLNKIIHGARSFLNKENVNFTVTEYSEQYLEPLCDDEMKIQPIIVNPEHKDRQSLNNIMNCVPIDEASPKLVERYSVKRIDQSPVICYAAKLKDYPGKLLPKVAVSLGVPKGPMFKLLKDGQTVTLPNGKKVTADEVMEPSIPGPSLIIIDCPTKKYMSGIIKHKSFMKYQKGGPEQATLVIHMMEKHLIKEALYQDWMSRFHEDTYHCIVDRNEISECPSVFRSQFAVQYKLHQVHPTIFPAVEQWRNKFTLQNGADNKDYSERVFFCKNMTKFTLRPAAQSGPDESEILKEVDVKLIVEEALQVLKQFGRTDSHDEKHSALSGLIEELRAGKLKSSEGRLDSNEHCVKNDLVSGKVDQAGLKRKRHAEKDKTEEVGGLSPKVCRCDSSSHLNVTENENNSKCSCFETSKSTERYPRIVFLGTGSSIPSKYRNVSSILIHTSPNTTILLDCGEGSYGQIVNHYGNEAENIIKRLQFIFISHMHADHHLGVIRVLKLHRKLLGKNSSNYVPPLVAGPEKFCTWLTEYGTSCESLEFRFADCKKFIDEEGFDSVLAESLPGLAKVVFVPVDHHTEAYGVAMCHQDGWKITYSGDTEPCQALVDAGKDSSLLIHEATFEDGMEDEAKDKHHSTCGQAIEIAAKMNAKNVLLTHFSQRYSKLPVMKDQTPVAIAFDHMELHPDDVPEICSLLPKLQLLFPDEERTK